MCVGAADSTSMDSAQRLWARTIRSKYCIVSIFLILSFVVLCNCHTLGALLCIVVDTFCAWIPRCSCFPYFFFHCHSSTLFIKHHSF